MQKSNISECKVIWNRIYLKINPVPAQLRDNRNHCVISQWQPLCNQFSSTSWKWLFIQLFAQKSLKSSDSKVCYLSKAWLHGCSRTDFPEQELGDRLPTYAASRCCHGTQSLGAAAHKHKTVENPTSTNPWFLQSEQKERNTAGCVRKCQNRGIQPKGGQWRDET